MHRYLLLFFALCVLSSPLYAADAPVTDTESVEEPESGDDSMESPKNELSPAQEEAEERTMEKAEEKTKNAPPEKKPGENLESGSNAVILQGLNKVSAAASRIEAVVGSTVRFGTLEVNVRSCWKSAPGDRPENAALLEINEIRQGEPPAKVFLGWMFSSSPGLSSLENPFYDITVIKCEKVDTSKL